MTAASGPRAGAGWPPREALREGATTAVAGRWISALLFLLVVLGTAVPAFADILDVNSTVSSEQKWVQSGGRVLVAEQREGSIPAAPCDALNRQDGVVGAAAITRQAIPLALTSAPEAQITLVTATPGIWNLLATAGPVRRPTAAPVAIVPATLAKRLGLRDGDLVQLIVGRPDAAPGDAEQAAGGTLGIELADTPIPIAVADTSLLGEALATGIILIATPTGQAQQCFVSLDASRVAAARASLGSVFAVDGRDAVVSDRLISGKFTTDYTAAYVSRPLKFGPFAAGAVIGLVWALVRWMRRSHDALYTTLGAGPGTRAIIRGTEWTVIAVLGGLASFALTVGLALARGVDGGIAAEYASRFIGSSLLVATAIIAFTLLMKPPSVLSALKDR